MSLLNNKLYVAAPVEVVKVTKDNMEEVAEWCGGRVAETKSRRVKGRMDAYVWVPTPNGSVISWAFEGMFITKRLAVTEKNELKATYSVFRKDYFTKNYFNTMAEAVDKTWNRQEREEAKARKKARTITIEVPEDMDVAEVSQQVQELVANDVPKAQGDINNPFALKSEPDESVADLPNSMVEQRESLHEDAVEAASE